MNSNILSVYYLLMAMMVMYWFISTGQMVIICIKGSVMLYTQAFQVNIGWADGPFLFVTFWRFDIAFEWDGIYPILEVDYEADEAYTSEII